MELNTILELVKAGFNRDEIMQMEQPTVQNPNPEPVQEPEPAPEQVAVAVPAPQPTPQPVQTPAQDQPTMSDIMQGLAKLTSAIQANAIAQSTIPGGLHNAPSAEDMLAEIIRPTYKGGEK